MKLWKDSKGKKKNVCEVKCQGTRGVLAVIEKARGREKGKKQWY